MVSRYFKIEFGITRALICAWVITMAGCATPNVTPEAAQTVAKIGEASLQDFEQKLGVKIEGVHLSAAGYMLDFRYRVLDTAKAVPLMSRKIDPYLLDETSGIRYGVPDSPNVGQLRSSSRSKVIVDRIYFILFANPGRAVQTGAKLTLVMGDMRLADLKVE
ncbi:MAG: hypothetical protein WCD07_12520 [Burkholderiales bacterium]